jgi:hypothetical protein
MRPARDNATLSGDLNRPSPNGGFVENMPTENFITQISRVLVAKKPHIMQAIEVPTKVPFLDLSDYRI